MELEIRLSVRPLVEFLRQTGSIDSRFTGFDRANEGARLHRRKPCRRHGIEVLFPAVYR